MSEQLELGQMAFGNPPGDWPCPHWVDALVAEIIGEICRVYWNTHQKQWDKHCDPGIPGIEFRPYFWGDDKTEAAKPNLKHGDIEVRWYKHPGRGTSLNVAAEPVRMVAWFESAMRCVMLLDR